jgi:hypothetical protein
LPEIKTNQEGKGFIEKSMQTGLLLLNLMLSSFLTGLIWFVQIVHYPLFSKVPASGFIPYQTTHMQTTTYVVAAPMLLELVVAAWLCLYPFPGNLRVVMYAAFACVLLIWGITFFVSVPIHNELITGWRFDLISKLVSTNWLRTFAWTTRTFLLGYLLWKMINH